MTRPAKTEDALEWYQNLAVGNPRLFVELVIRSFEDIPLSADEIRGEAMEELAQATLVADIEKNPERYSIR